MPAIAADAAGSAGRRPKNTTERNRGLERGPPRLLAGWVRFESLQSTDDDILIDKRNATGSNRSYTFTVEQRMVNGSASGTATTYYYHSDHLGSTNAVTNMSRPEAAMPTCAATPAPC